MKSTILLLLLVWLTAGAGSQLFAQNAGLKTNFLYDATTTIHLGYETALSRKLTLDVWVNYNPWTLGHKWVGLDEDKLAADEKSVMGPTASERASQFRHLLVQPELRWWLCQKFNGHFIGLHLHGGLFTVGALKLPFDWGRYGSKDNKGNFTYLGGDDLVNMRPVGYPNLTVQGIGYRKGTRVYAGLEQQGLTPGQLEQETVWGNADRDGIYINTFEGWLAGIGVSYGYHWILSQRWSLEFTVGAGYAYLDMEKSRCTDCKKKLGDEKVHYFGPTRAGISLVYMIK